MRYYNNEALLNQIAAISKVYYDIIDYVYGYVITAI